MTKKLLLGLSGIVVLTAASFSIVSCSKKKAVVESEISYSFDTIRWNAAKKAAGDNLTAEKFAKWLEKSEKEATDLFSEKPEGKNSFKIKSAKATDGIIKITLEANKDFKLSETEFEIKFSDGSLIPKDKTFKSTYDKTKFVALKTSSKTTSLKTFVDYISDAKNIDEISVVFGLKNKLKSVAAKETKTNSGIIEIELTAKNDYILSESKYRLAYENGELQKVATVSYSKDAEKLNALKKLIIGDNTGTAVKFFNFNAWFSVKENKTKKELYEIFSANPQDSFEISSINELKDKENVVIFVIKAKAGFYFEDSDELKIEVDFS